jgi:hypothetical protein
MLGDRERRYMWSLFFSALFLCKTKTALKVRPMT